MEQFRIDIDKIVSIKPSCYSKNGWNWKLIVPALSALLAVILSAVLFFSDRFADNPEQSLSAQSIFAGEDEYINHIRNVEFHDVELKIVTIQRGDNFWVVARRNGVDIDTLIGANPYWNNLLARTEQHIVVPSEKGVLHFITELDEIEEIIREHSASTDDIVIQRLPFLHRYYRKLLTDPPPIAVFVKGARPTTANMTASLAAQFSLREMFRSPLGGRFSSFFGSRIHPIFNRRRFHNGIDIAARHGTPVGAPARGRVISAGWMGGFGKAVVIAHPQGYKTLCGHLSRIHVRPGQYVYPGKFIGRVGSTGYSTGPHLHFTLWKNGREIDPMKVLW